MLDTHATSQPSSTSQPPQRAEVGSGNQDAEVRDGLLALMPFMRNLSRSLCRDATLSEDILQEAMCHAWAAREDFRPGTNLKAWVITILRNAYYNHCRRAWRSVALRDEVALNMPGLDDEQEWSVHLNDTLDALGILSNVQRKALLLVAVGGYKYEDAAKMCGCPVGTAKSRVTRARKRILAALEGAEGSLHREHTPHGAAPSRLLEELDTIIRTPNTGESDPDEQPHGT